MRTAVDPMFLAMFASGDYDLLYEEGERERAGERERHEKAERSTPEGAELFRLSDGRHHAVVRKLTKRTGVVVESNLFPKGAVVRSKVNWAFAVKPRNGWGTSTFVSPRTLEIEARASTSAA